MTSVDQDPETDNRTKLSRPLEKRRLFSRLFENPWSTWYFPGFFDVCRTVPKFATKSGLPKQAVIDQELPVVTPDQLQLEKPPIEAGIQFTWLGHASCLVQLNGVNVLTDPITSDRCSFSSYMGKQECIPNMLFKLL